MTCLVWRWESQTHVLKSNFRGNGEACFPSFHGNMISCRNLEKYNVIPNEQLEIHLGGKNSIQTHVFPVESIFVCICMNYILLS